MKISTPNTSVTGLLLPKKALVKARKLGAKNQKKNTELN